MLLPCSTGQRYHSCAQESSGTVQRPWRGTRGDLLKGRTKQMAVGTRKENFFVFFGGGFVSAEVLEYLRSWTLPTLWHSTSSHPCQFRFNPSTTPGPVPKPKQQVCVVLTPRWALILAWWLRIQVACLKNATELKIPWLNRRKYQLHDWKCEQGRDYSTP